MATEQTPLLSERLQNVVDSEHPTIYDRFTPHQKAVILGMVSFCGLLPRTLVTVPVSWISVAVLTIYYSANIWILRSPDLADRKGSRFNWFYSQVSMGIVPSDISPSCGYSSLAFSVSVFAAGLGTFFGGSYSTFCKCQCIRSHTTIMINLKSCLLSRWPQAGISLWIEPAFHWFYRCRVCQIYPRANDLAVLSNVWCFPAARSWGRCHRRHLSVRTTRYRYGDISYG
jgi:hypothetical protein